MKENDPSSVLLFLAGTKKDLSVSNFYEKYKQKVEIKVQEIHHTV